MKLHAEVNDSSDLSNKENVVLKLLSEGLSYQQIADYLHRSIRTVESHTAHIISKLGAELEPGAIQYWGTTGLENEKNWWAMFGIALAVGLFCFVLSIVCLVAAVIDIPMAFVRWIDKSMEAGK